MINKILAKISGVLENASNREKDRVYRKKFKIHNTATLRYLPHIVFKGDIEIGHDSYVNSGRIASGANSKVVIGSWCAIGANVNIHAITHDPEDATGPENSRNAVEGDIIIGNNVWVGSNTFILPGITVGSNSVIAANAVVTKNVPDNAIVGGIPAKVIRFKKSLNTSNIKDKV